MKKFSVILTILLLALALGIKAIPVHALNLGNTEVKIGTETSVKKIACRGLLSYMQFLIDYLTAGIVVLGVILIVVGGFIYMTAGGDSGKLGTGKTFVSAALVGIALSLTAWLLLNTISAQFTSGLKNPSELLRLPDEAVPPCN